MQIAAKVITARRRREYLHRLRRRGEELTLIGIDRDRKTCAARALLAKAERSKLVYAGAAFLALNSDDRKELQAKLAALVQEQPAFPWLRNRKAQWVPPKLSMKVKHLAGARLLRHGSLRTLLNCQSS